MSDPTRDCMPKLVRLGRYLIGRERFCVTFKYQDKLEYIDTHVDSDHAGDKGT